MDSEYERDAECQFRKARLAYKAKQVINNVA